MCPQITKEELFIALGSPDQTSKSVTTKPSFGKRQMLPLLKLLHPEYFILIYFEKKVTYKEKAGRRGILHRILLKKWEQAGSRFFLTKQVRVHTKRDFSLCLFFSGRQMKLWEEISETGSRLTNSVLILSCA